MIITDFRKPSKPSTPINLPSQAGDPVRAGSVPFFSAAACLAPCRTTVGYGEYVYAKTLHPDPTLLRR